LDKVVQLLQFIINMDWKKIQTSGDLDNISKESFHQPVLIFKHSTRCSISSMIRSRLENSWDQDALDIEPYFLDLIAFRAVSNKIENQFQVRHQSPQVLLIHEGICIFHGSHLGVSHGAIRKALHQLSLQNER